ncbi:MAG: tetratricopeptide repeat protein [Armatimonadetes bacterium]|nr:tetratricopeptide repeat protein [Armatimonadota bacterium]
MVKVTLATCAEAGGQATSFTGDGFLCVIPCLEAALSMGEKLIRRMNAAGQGIRVAINCSATIPENLREFAPNTSTESSESHNYSPNFYYFDNESYLDVAKAARLLSITRANQILVTEQARQAGGDVSQVAEKWYDAHPKMVLKNFEDPETVCEYIWDDKTKGRPLAPFLPEFYSRRGSKYVDRPELEANIRQGIYDAAHHDSLSPILVIHGEGGTGKTRLAEEAILSIAGLFRTAVWINVAGEIMSQEEAEMLGSNQYNFSRENLLPEYARRLSERMAEKLGFLEEVKKDDQEVSGDHKNVETFTKSFYKCLKVFHGRNPKGFVVIDNWEPLNFRRGDSNAAKACCQWLQQVKSIAYSWSFVITSRDVPALFPEPKCINIDEGLSESEALTLLKARLEGSQSEDGLKRLAIACGFHPLALELACARSAEHYLSPNDIASEIEQLTTLFLETEDVLAPDSQSQLRQAKLQASLEFSYNLLSPEEQRAYRSSSLFVSPWSREAGVTVIGDDGSLHKSLVRASRFRHSERSVGNAVIHYFWLHPAAREFAKSKLAERDDERSAALESLQNWALTTTASPRPADFSRLQIDEDNWLEGLRLAAPAQPAQISARLHDLRSYAWTSGRMRGLRTWAHDDSLPDSVKASALFHLGRQEFREGRIHDALSSWEKAESLFATSDDYHGRGLVAKGIGDIHFRVGRNDEALRAWQSAAQLLEISEDIIGQGNVAMGIGALHFQEGRHPEALDWWRRAKFLYVDAESAQGQGNVAIRIGILCFREGRYQDALAELREAEQFYVSSGDPQGQGQVLKTIGDIHFREERNQEAIEAWQRADQFFVVSGDPLGRGDVLLGSGDLHFRESRISEAKCAWEQALEFYGAAGDLQGRGNALKRFGDLHSLDKMDDEALTAWEKAQDCFLACKDPVGFGEVALSLAQLHRSRADLSHAGLQLQIAKENFQKCNYRFGLEIVAKEQAEIAKLSASLL